MQKDNRKKRLIEITNRIKQNQELLEIVNEKFIGTSVSGEINIALQKIKNATKFLNEAIKNYDGE